jgi:hypothetical protein
MAEFRLLCGSPRCALSAKLVGEMVGPGLLACGTVNLLGVVIAWQNASASISHRLRELQRCNPRNAAAQYEGRERVTERPT